MAEELPSPAPELKPWYYQDWFLIPMFPFWPLWAVLILRSPWHNGMASGAVAWAMLIVGGYLILWEQLVQSRELNDVTIVLILPGILFTVITQGHWFRYKGVLRNSGQAADSPTAVTDSRQPQRSGPRRRVRRRASRTGGDRGRRR